jgi:epoxyqueuosine reductase
VTLVALALTAAVKARARELGFDRVGIGPATPPPHGAAFEAWLEAGHAATMGYLERGRADRLDPGRLLPDVRSVVAVALSYKPASEEESWRGVAAYARGADYHDVLRERLAALSAFIADSAGPDVTTRVAVDTSAVLERDLAARAGLGWIGKNTNLLAPDLGSLFFIGIVLTTAALAFDEAPPDRCGRCTACLDACPTRAFAGPYVLDARRCISYLTIEHRGDIDDALREGVGEWLFGCDVCQDVCPWNAKAATTREPAWQPAHALESPAALLALTPETFRARFRGSAMTRAKRGGLLRNAALVLGNRRDTDAVPALRRALGDPEPSVRSAAEWALARIAGHEGRAVSPDRGCLIQGGSSRMLTPVEEDP